MPRPEVNDWEASCCVQQVCNYESMHAAMCGSLFPLLSLVRRAGSARRRLPIRRGPVGPALQHRVLLASKLQCGVVVAENSALVCDAGISHPLVDT